MQEKKFVEKPSISHRASGPTALRRRIPSESKKHSPHAFQEPGVAARLPNEALARPDDGPRAI
jgi:hypothetical protein